MKSGRLLQLSGAVVDLIYRIDQLPEPGDEVLAKSVETAVGGGFNAMLAARRSGLAVVYGGGLGSGPFSDLLREALWREEIEALREANGALDQGSCVVLVDKEGERTFISREGAEGLLKYWMLRPIEAGAYDWIMLSGYALAYVGSRDALHRYLCSLPEEASLVFDPSPAVASIPESILADVLAAARWVSLNTREARQITGFDDPATAGEALLTEHCPAAAGIVLRCGAVGCWLCPRGQAPELLPAFPVKTVDTNGAGDAHIGAFLGALGAGAEPREAVRYANAAAALSTTRNGPATCPPMAEVLAFLRTREPDRRSPIPARDEPGEPLANVDYSLLQQGRTES